MPGILHYVASKGAITAMTRATARELGPHKIRVNAIAPGLIMTEGTASQPIFKGDGLSTNIASRCLAREAFPEDVVGAVVFLASDSAGFITGQTLVVDGGSVMV
jgi:NAD(P)-dependent dehydrogenase (short-subunit alcohol dehydrogenase family)